MSYPPPASENPFVQPQSGPPPAKSPFSGKTLWIVVGAVVGIIILCCSGSLVVGVLSGDTGSSESSSEDTAGEESEPAETVTVEQTVTEDGSSEPEPEETRKSREDEDDDDPPAEDPDTFAMPDETGMVLQDAQDHMQELADNPFYVTFSEDATGDGRFQVLDDGWQVCSQDPAPGEPVPYDNSLDITFYVVRTSESCP